jgi:hypothetical protein
MMFKFFEKKKKKDGPSLGYELSQEARQPEMMLNAYID